MSPWSVAVSLLPLLPGLPACEAFGGSAEARHHDLLTKHVGSGSVIQPVSDAVSDLLTKHDAPVEEEEKWPRPVPRVQGDDQDFLKDENFDNGQWQLQNDYDRLRNRLAAARAARAAALHDAEVTQQRLENTRLEEQQAHAKAREANAARRVAERQAEEALRRAQARYDEAQAKRAQVGGVAAQQQEVSKEAQQLDRCEEELAAARARLEALQAQKVKAESKAREFAKEEKVAEEKEMEKEQEEAVMETKVNRAQKKVDKAHRHHMQSTAEEETTARKLKDSEARLRRFRHPEEVKSQACVRPVALLTVLAALAGGGLLQHFSLP